MHPKPEDRPPPDAESNRDSIEAILKLAARLAGAERAFLARAAGPAAEVSVDACVGTRADGERTPSRTALALALEATAPVLWLDVPADQGLDAASVRGLKLRSVLAAPVTLDAGRAALVLDTRADVALAPSDVRSILEPLAVLLSRLLRRGPPPMVARTSASSGSPAAQPACRRRPQPPRDWVQRVAATELPVLVQGESGAGKEEVARVLHRLSPRRTGPFVAVNCAALTESLLEAELFGSVRGAYTGAERDRPGLFRRANGGTLFLDEVGDMPGPMQAKLLRSIEHGYVRPVGGTDEVAVDVRIVAATHRDLARRVGEGLFRHDLYYRLAVLRVDVPPLRERQTELPSLLAQLTPRLLRQTGCRDLRLSPEAWGWLRVQPWPGNVRELHAVLARALLRTGGKEIGTDDLQPLDPPESGRPAGMPLEARMIDFALEECRGNLAGAARRIGWTRQKLYRRMQALGLTIPESESESETDPLPGRRRCLQPGNTSSDSSTFQ